MARIVKLSDQTPLIIQEKDLVNGMCAVCRCGLSGAWPMCDGTHKATVGEERGRLYRYEREMPQGTVRREEVGEHQEFPQQRAEGRRPQRPDPTRFDGQAEGTVPVEKHSTERAADQGREESASPAAGAAGGARRAEGADDERVEDDGHELRRAA